MVGVSVVGLSVKGELVLFTGDAEGACGLWGNIVGEEVGGVGGVGDFDGFDVVGDFDGVRVVGNRVGDLEGARDGDLEGARDGDLLGDVGTAKEPWATSASASSSASADTRMVLVVGGGRAFPCVE
jgi:hypothetical protein